MIVNDADRYACGRDSLGVLYLKSYAAWFLDNFLPLAGFLQIGVELAPFIEIEFHDTTNPV
jgi:hypothetical protein